ncbi:Zn-dependent exopeptidase [Metschnikowia bicuspidata]|uniref:Peptide hydrolase n=1 Tax=Metschnikowia bicuspidata TaxID=27322 RepID=A0A4P9ZEY5_9ASCO|nr:Zn-dependent exopeptidase [Metschnikowia bicuspidata]
MPSSRAISPSHELPEPPTQSPQCYSAVDEESTLYSRKLEEAPQGFWKRFWVLFLLGIAALFVADLVFLPRTSPNRDFRRWHGLRLTKVDAERKFLTLVWPERHALDGYTTEEHLGTLLRNLSEINMRRPASVAGSERPDLVRFVHSHMSGIHYDTRVFHYQLPSALQTPLSLNLTLVDPKSGQKLYTAPLTEPGLSSPVFFAYSRAGTLRAPYVNANMGTPADYSLLARHNVLLRGRIVVFVHDEESDYELADTIALAESSGCAGVVVGGSKSVPDAISRNYRPFSVPKHAFRLPASWNDVQPLLTALGASSGEFRRWQYAPFSNDALELEMRSEFGLQPLEAIEIVATMGSALHDGVVVVGAARDSFSSSNPLSGHAIMLELMQRLGELRDLGWLPLRTIKFVSWDASRSGALGSESALKDAKFLGKTPILAYVNLDEDAVRGTQLVVDASPFFNDVLWQVARSIPYFEPDQKPHTERKGATLWDHWCRENNATVNNRLGYALAGTDAGVFQITKQAATINVKFAGNSHDTYVPDAGYFEYDWVKKNDRGFGLHGALVRFVGLLVISLGESEVVARRAETYFLQLEHFFADAVSAFKGFNEAWGKQNVYSLLESAGGALFRDATRGGGEKVTLESVFEVVSELLRATTRRAAALDKYGEEVQNLWTSDLPWFRLPKKVMVYFSFKRHNRKLLALEQLLATDWGHIMYDVPRGVMSVAKKRRRGEFGALFEAYEKDVSAVVAVLVTKYERVKAVWEAL